jgi:hypothetical protein
MTNAEMRSALDSAISRRDNAATVRERREADRVAQALQREMQTQQLAAQKEIARMQIAASRASGGGERMTDTEREIQRRARFLMSPGGGGLSEDAALSQAYDENAGAAAYARAYAGNQGIADIFGRMRQGGPEEQLGNNFNQRNSQLGSRPLVGQQAADSNVVNLGVFR